MSYDFYMTELICLLEYDLPFFMGEPWYTIQEVEVVEGLNYTYNVHAMFRMALGIDPATEAAGVRRIEGMSGKEAEPLLELALSHMYNFDNRAAYIELNPPNNWGNFEGARRTIKKLFRWAQAYPNAVFRIC